MDDLPVLLFPSQAARLMKVGPKTLERWRKEGRGDLLPFAFIGEGQLRMAVYSKDACLIARNVRAKREAKARALPPTKA